MPVDRRTDDKYGQETQQVAAAPLGEEEAKGAEEKAGQEAEKKKATPAAEGEQRQQERRDEIRPGEVIEVGKRRPIKGRATRGGSGSGPTAFGE